MKRKKRKEKKKKNEYRHEEACKLKAAIKYC